MISPLPTTSRVVIFGTGAVGQIYGYIFHKAGATVTTVCRSNYAQAKDQGFKILVGPHGQASFQPSVIQSVASVNYHDPVDYVIVCTKAFPGLVKTIRPAVGPSTTIALFQNGIGIEKEYAAKFPQNPLLSAVVLLTAKRIGPTTTAAGNFGSVELGVYETRVTTDIVARKIKHLADLIMAGGGVAEIYEDIQSRRWIKLVINAALNPICALTRLTHLRFLKSNPNAAALLQGAMEEVVCVAQACGFKAVTNKTAATCLKLCVRETNSVLYDDVEPSMLQDVRMEKKLEVEAILGNILKKAKERNVDTPILSVLHTLTTSLSLALDSSSKN